MPSLGRFVMREDGRDDSRSHNRPEEVEVIVPSAPR